MVAVFLTRAATEIAVEFVRLPPALLRRISMQLRLLRSTRRRPSMPCPQARTSGPDRFRRAARRPLHPRCWLHKECRCLDRLPAVLEADLPATWEGSIPRPFSELA